MLTHETRTEFNEELDALIKKYEIEGLFICATFDNHFLLINKDVEAHPVTEILYQMCDKAAKRLYGHSADVTDVIPPSGQGGT